MKGQMSETAHANLTKKPIKGQILCPASFS